jgi:chromosome transmission fidelity protein 1
MRYAHFGLHAFVFSANRACCSLCRETLGIRLKGAILIVDEAHNLPEAVADSAAAALTGSAAATAAAALSGYLTRYRSRLSAGNLRHLATLLTAARALQRTVAAASGGVAPKTDAGAAAGKAPPARLPAAAADATRVLRLNEFLFEAGIDHMNMFKLGRYCRDRCAVFGVLVYSAAC